MNQYDFKDKTVRQLLFAAKSKTIKPILHRVKIYRKIKLTLLQPNLWQIVQLEATNSSVLDVACLFPRLWDYSPALALDNILVLSHLYNVMWITVSYHIDITAGLNEKSYDLFVSVTNSEMQWCLILRLSGSGSKIQFTICFNQQSGNFNSSVSEK